MIKRGRILLLISILGLVLLAPATALAQESVEDCTNANGAFFPETGHNVCGPFYRFLTSRGGVALFGYPVTRAFQNKDGRWVQYFQRARMEYYPELPPADRVQLGALGAAYAPQDRMAPLAPTEKPKSNDPARRYFPETGHTVQFSFLEFFKEQGGLELFGNPITEFFPENGRIVQYFERVKMEWNPNRGGVTLRNVGENWIDQHPELKRYAEPQMPFAPGNGTPAPLPSITSLRATVSVRDALTGRTSEQTVWVYVTDQNDRPVEGADVTLIAFVMPTARMVPLAPTDDAGHTETTFKFENLIPGQLVVLEARIAYEGLTSQARSFFLAWW